MLKWRLIKNVPNARPRWFLPVENIVNERVAGLVARFFVELPRIIDRLSFYHEYHKYSEYREFNKNIGGIRLFAPFVIKIDPGLIYVN